MRLISRIDRVVRCFTILLHLKVSGTIKLPEKIYTADTVRCALILNSVKKYVTDIHSVKGLGFCISVVHAEYMAKYFNIHGVPSIALSSKSADDIRTDAKDALISGKINFIFVVDLYNEGVDIPVISTPSCSSVRQKVRQSSCSSLAVV